jgi:hypothetical protein
MVWQAVDREGKDARQLAMDKGHVAFVEAIDVSLLFYLCVWTLASESLLFGSGVVVGDFG